MSHGLAALLGNDFGKIEFGEGAEAFAQKVIAAARKHHISLSSIPELANADLNNDGKIDVKEIAALITAAHEKRAGKEFVIVSSENGTKDGHAVRNTDYDRNITAKDITAMTNPDIAEKAKQSIQEDRALPTVEQLLKAMDKETMNTLKSIKGGIETIDAIHEPSNNSIGQPSRQPGVTR